MKKVASVLRRLRRGIAWATPGQLDAGFASLATFVTGIYAVRELSTESLGGYVLLFSAVTVANQLPAELVFYPSQILAVDLPFDRRLGMLAHSIPRGSLLLVVSSLAVPLGVWTLAARIPTSELIPLSISASLFAMITPLQDHLRTMLHMAQTSWMAAVMSMVNFATTVCAVLVFAQTAPIWVPFGGLFLGNLVSVLVGSLWIRRARIPAPPKPTFRELRWLGGWLLTTGLSKTGLRYAITAVLNQVAGVAALGYVEGARVVSQPINVLAQGLMAQVGPQITRAGASKDRTLARIWIRRFGLVLSVAAIPYAAVAAWPWAANPLARIAPRAYTVTGLTAATLAVIILSSVLRPLRLQLLGARRQKLVAWATVTTGLVELALITTGILIGAFAAPLAAGVGAVITMIWFNRQIAGIYRESRESNRPMTKSSPRE